MRAGLLTETILLQESVPVKNEFGATSMEWVDYLQTYNEHAGSYSYVLTKIGEEYYFVDTLTDGVSKDKLKAEEHCINKYVNYYSKPRFRYSNSIKNRDISLNSILKENTLNKNFVINSITYDLINNKCDVELNEIR